MKVPSETTRWNFRFELCFFPFLRYSIVSYICMDVHSIRLLYIYMCLGATSALRNSRSSMMTHSFPDVTCPLRIARKCQNLLEILGLSILQWLLQWIWHAWFVDSRHCFYLLFEKWQKPLPWKRAGYLIIFLNFSEAGPQSCPAWMIWNYNQGTVVRVQKFDHQRPWVPSTNEWAYLPTHIVSSGERWRYLKEIVPASSMLPSSVPWVFRHNNTPDII